MLFSENKTAAYLRLSREDGDKLESDSIKNQRELIRDYISKHNDLHLVDEYPEYIHLRVNEEKKYLFIEKCERDMDAFRILYKQALDNKAIREHSCYINAKNFLEYLAGVIGVPTDSPSLRFKGLPMSDGTVFIDLNHYEVIESKKQ